MVKKTFKYTHVGRLPEDWDCLQAIEVIDEISMGPFGSDITVSNFVSSGVPVLNGYNVSQIMLIDKFQNFVTPKKAKELKKAVAHRGDIIVTHRGTIGQVSYIPDSSAYSEYVISQSQFRVHFNDKRVNPRFLVSYLLSPIGQKYLLETKGHTGVPALAQPTTNFRRLWIPLPEIAEQVSIAEALSDIDSLISSLHQMIEKKKAIKKGAMQELLTGKKRLPGFSGEWEKNTLKQICEFINGRAYSQHELLSGGKYKVLRLGNLFTNSHWYYTDLELNEKQYCEKGDLLYAWSASFGPTIWDGEKSVFHYHIWKIKCSEIIDKKYLYHFLNADVSSILNELQGGTMFHLTKENMENRLCSYPNLDEQRAIAQVLSDMDCEIEQLEKKLAKYQQVKQGMMQELLSGRIRLVDKYN